MNERPAPYLEHVTTIGKPRALPLDAKRDPSGRFRIAVVREVVRVDRVARAYRELSFEKALVTDRVPVREYVTHEDVEVLHGSPEPVET